MASIKELAEMVGAKAFGNIEATIVDVADLESAGPTDLSFLANPKYAHHLKTTQAGAILVKEVPQDSKLSFIQCEDPYLALAKIAQHLRPHTFEIEPTEAPSHISPEASIHPTARVAAGVFVGTGSRIDAGARIHSGAYVGAHAVIGRDTVLYPRSVVMPRCEIGSKCILHSGSVIGADGFGFAPDQSGIRHKVPQLGIVTLGDDVEVGANTAIDRGTFGATRIGRGTKIDNLVQIGHNVVVGEDVVIAGQSGIAGSSKIGNRVVMGAQVGVAGHLSICDDVVLAARTGVTKSLHKPGVYAGFPAVPHRMWLRQMGLLRSLDRLRRRILKLGIEEEKQ